MIDAQYQDDYIRARPFFIAKITNAIEQSAATLKGAAEHHPTAGQVYIDYTAVNHPTAGQVYIDYTAVNIDYRARTYRVSQVKQRQLKQTNGTAVRRNPKSEQQVNQP